MKEEWTKSLVAAEDASGYNVTARRRAAPPERSFAIAHELDDTFPSL